MFKMKFNDFEAANLILNLKNPNRFKVLDSKNGILLKGSKIKIKYKMILDNGSTYYQWYNGIVERYYKSSKIYRIRFEDNSSINIRLNKNKENESWVRI